MLNFAIIGCGAIGQRHALQAAAHGKLLAVCDTVEEKASYLADKYQVRGYTSTKDMLEREKDLHVLAVCTPNGLHAAHSILGSRAGLHVICEKPMALSSADCREMIAEAGNAGKYLFVVKQNRFNPPVVAVKRMLEEGQLGRIFSVQVNASWCRGPGYYKDSWHGTRNMDGGILYTQFSHFIDLLYWMIGDVNEAVAYRHNFAHQGLTDFEDAVVAGLRFENEVIGSLHFTTNSYRKNMEGSLMIVAEKGTVKIGGEYLNTLEYARLMQDNAVELQAGNPANDYGVYQGSMSNHDKMYDYVVNVITKDYPNRFSGYEGLKTVEIIEKIYKAAS
jgi:UDP-N-acetyl-2-amino-2-deoxyglucuronate dehydrogenase